MPSPDPAAAGPRVGLVLGAGGVAGHAFHAGVLRALAEVTGWDPRTAELIVGTSAGSVVGVGLRADLSASDLYARVVGEPLSADGERLLGPLAAQDDGWWRQRVGTGVPRPASPRLVARLARRPWRARPGLVMAGLLPAGRIDVSRIADDTDALLEGTAASPERLWVVAVGLDDGRRVIFGRGPGPAAATWSWGDAVAASCAIPGVFTPVEVGGLRLVDGGAHSPINADLVVDQGLDAVVVCSPMSATRSRRPPASLDAPVRALYRLRLAGEVAGLRRRGIPVIVFQPTTEVLRAAGLRAAMDPRVREPVARAAYAAARARCESTAFREQATTLAA